MGKTIRRAVDGKWYTATFAEVDGHVSLFHHGATKRKPLEGTDAAAFAGQLLLELIRGNLGIADPEEPQAPS